MKQVVEMPEIIDCSVTGCSYNVKASCHAKGITVGDVNHGHLCDTMWMDKVHTQRQEGAGVGACRTTHCVYNDDFECQADSVEITLAGGQAQCATFLSQ